MTVKITDRAALVALKKKYKAHVSDRNESGCRIWRGPKQVRIGKLFLTPKRAAWMLRHGRLPIGEIKNTCETENCVYWKHLEEGAERNAGAKAASDRLGEKQIAEIRANREELSIPALAKKYNVSVGTIHRYLRAF